ncbi:MAG: glycosyltransferase family 39 protein [Candidatus Woesearchaeota archaeon]
MKTEKNQISILILLFIISIIIVKPIGEFPISDDWAHSLSVKHLINEYKLILNQWSPMTLVFQITYGGMFSKIFGYSFTTLRFSTLILSFICLISFYFLLREFNISQKKSLIATIFLLFNPIYFFLSFTFMTEIPFLTFMILSLLFYTKAIKLDSKFDNFFTDKKNKKTHNNTYKKKITLYLLLGSLFSSIAFLIRQNGILIFISLLFFLFINRKLNIRNFVIISFLPIITFFLFYYWYYFIHGPTTRYLLSSNQLISIKIILRIIVYSFQSILIISFYFSPFIYSYFSDKGYSNLFLKQKNKNYHIFFLILLTLFLYIGIILYKNFFNDLPYTGVFSFNGIGLIYTFNYIPKIFTFIINLFILITASLFIFLFIKFVKKIITEKDNLFFSHKTKNINLFNFKDEIIFIYILTFFQFLFIIITPGFFDRYLIPVFPGIIIFFIKNIKKLSKVFYFLLFFFILFSIISTKDYFVYNNAKWKLLNFLLENNISPYKINGGFEFNGYYLSEYFYNITNNKEPKPGKKGLFIEEEEYFISQEKINNTILLKELKYSTYFGLINHKIYLNKRTI